MTTVGEKQADVATLIDDIAATALGLSSDEWSDADTDVTNDGSDNLWQNNGRVLHHGPSDTYLLWYIPTSGFRSPMNEEGRFMHGTQGVRVVHSTDWDAVNTRPAGQTTISKPDSMDISGSVAGSTDRSASFTDTRYQVTDGTAPGGQGIWMYLGTAQERAQSVISRSDARSYPATYSISCRSDGVAVAAWNTTDGTYGTAGSYAFEHMDNRFWADGVTPTAQLTHGSGGYRGGDYGRFGIATYGFSAHYSDENANTDVAGNDAGVISDAGFGSINPDAADESFFFRKPAIFASNGGETPVANLESALPNDASTGAAHGDTITHDGTTYRILKQSGASGRVLVTLGLQFE